MAGREAKAGQGRLWAGLPVENGQAIDLHSAIRHEGVHRIFLLIVLSRNPAWSQQDKKKHRGEERENCVLIAMRVKTPSH